MKQARGFMMVLVLLIAALVLVLGLGFLSSNSPRYNASVYARTSAQARALAEAGMEDARVKLQKDPGFPPRVSAAQSTYAYREVVRDLGGQVVGSYVVTLDWTYAVAPYHVITVTSQGLVGTDAAQPTGNCVLHATFDFYPVDLSKPAHPRQQNHARMINFWEDSQ
jgi:Tfp pilus assembly protein PilV